MKNSKLLSLLCIVFTALAISGCSSDSVSSKDMCKYLEDKYDTQFEFMSIINNSPVPFSNNPVKTAQFKCSDYSELITISYNSKTKTYQDNFQAVVYYDDVVSRFENIVESLDIQKYKTEFRISEVPIEYGCSLDDYLANDGAFKGITIVTDKNLEDSFPEELTNKLIQENISVQGRVAQVLDITAIDDTYGLNNSTIGDNVVRAFNFKVSNNEVDRINWTD